MRKYLPPVLLALALAPGLWWRSPPPPTHFDAGVQVIALDAPARVGAFDVLGAWQLASRNEHFGGYSGILTTADDMLLTISDRGRVLTMPRPGRSGPVTMRDLDVGGAGSKRDVDVESLTRDPASGALWFGYEGSNAIERRDPELRGAERTQPAAMMGWGSNSGPEAMVRLADGRFLVISEGVNGGYPDPYPALLFPSDPVEGAEPIEFGFAAPSGFRPVDAEQLPDGDVLILVRRIDWTLPPGFVSAIVRADPAEIVAGKPWRGEVIARFAGEMPRDNFEGLGLDPDSPPEAPVLWLISDDNRSEFQRTLLYKLQLRPRQEARSGAARSE